VLGLSGNSGAISHVPEIGHGIWLYLHEQFFARGEALRDRVDKTVLHELNHNERIQCGESPKHRDEPWARRCLEMSDRLGIKVRIERPRSIRVNGRVTTGTPDGCLSYHDLRRWPHSVLTEGPPLRVRAMAL
jgi:hypothetical protein